MKIPAIPDPIYLTRANQTRKFSGYDCLENYKEKNKFGPNLYKPDSITYKYNSLGFRCDEFDVPSEKSVLFLGCSITEGIGLPQEVIWPTLLLDKIKTYTGFNLSYQNLALAGRGIDCVATYILWFSKFKPIDFVYIYIPSLYRRDYFFQSNECKIWGPNFKKPEAKSFEHLFLDDHFAFYQSRRSLNIIDLVRQITNCNIIMSGLPWSDFNFDLNHYSLFDEFPKLNFVKSLIKVKDLARDSLHFGPSWHKDLSEFMWQHTKHWYDSV